MSLESGSEILEVLRSFFFAYFLIAIPIFVSISPSCLASTEFPAFRLQQFDLHGSSYGSSGSIINYETRVLPGSQIVSSPRRCYLVKLVDLTLEMYRNLLKFSVAGVVIVVPSNFLSIDEETIEQVQQLEHLMVMEATSIPIYLVRETEQLQQVYETVKQSAESLGTHASAFQTLLHHIHGNGVQLITGNTIGTPKVKTDAQIVNIQGALVGSRTDRNFPILVTAHYDSMSPAPELSFGADSNGSGVTLLLELARIFSHLYHYQGSSNTKLPTWTSSSASQKSLLFLLSGAGYFNYQGTQKYLEDQIDSSDNSDIQDTRLVICLDSLAGIKNNLFIHVSRSVRDGTMLQTFIRNLNEVTKKLYPELTVELIQKKVRTESLLSWEHEKFHLKKINAITLSSHQNPDDIKSTVLDTKDRIDIEDLAIKTHAIAEALAASLYNVTEIGTAFSGSLGVSKESLSSTLQYISSEPRSAQLLASKQNKFVQSLRSLLARYTHETNVFVMKPDKRDANLVLYDTTGGVITAYGVKPAVFDLVLSIVIAAYLGFIYLLLKRFPKFWVTAEKYLKPMSTISNGSNNYNTNKREKIQ